MSRGSRVAAALLVGGMIWCLPSALLAAAVLRISGMTFVSSRESEREVVLRSREAVFEPEAGIAELVDVNAEVTVSDEGLSFTMECDRAELNVETNDFIARGDVHGQTRDGQHYEAPWVRYVHDEGLLYTDAPVHMVDEVGSFRGDGFRYHVHERRFELLGNVRVEQTP